MERVCSGYFEGLDLVLRDQNQVVKATVERRQKAATKSRSKSPKLGLVSQSMPTSLLPSLPESQEAHALCFFTTFHVGFPRDPRTDRGFLDILPLLYSSLRPSSPLSLSYYPSLFVSSVRGSLRSGKWSPLPVSVRMARPLQLREWRCKAHWTVQLMKH